MKVAAIAPVNIPPSMVAPKRPVAIAYALINHSRTGTNKALASSTPFFGLLGIVDEHVVVIGSNFGE
jgi:hypothetical protein